MERTEYSEAEQFDSVTSLEAHPNAKKKKNKSKNNRRFSDEQIRLLETIFEADSKLEPRKKVQLARELGLQPRQVAIWFQNRRARWKSKQIEQDFGTLRADYDKLASRFDSLKEEKQSLLNQLQKLNDLLGQHHDGNMDRIGFEGNNDVSGSSNKDHGNCETGEVKPSFLQEDELKHREHRGVVQSHKNTSADVGDYGDEGHELLIMGHVDASVSPEDWHRFDSGSLHWLNFWT